METRSRKAASFVASLPDCAEINITKTSQIHSYRSIAKRSQAFATKAIIFSISLNRLASSNIVEMGTLLSYSRRITTLSIDVQGLSVLQCLRLFSNITFGNLQSFSTQTLPHEGLYPFIRNHPDISDLELGPCSQRLTGSPCALQPIGALQQLEDVRGNFKCISALVSNKTHRILAKTSTADDSDYLGLFQKILDIRASIRLFSTNFMPRDTDIMPRLAAALPGVSTLRLIEFIDKEAVDPDIYPWHSLAWGRNLRSLHELKRLHIHTTDKFVGKPGNKSEEREMILAWTKDEGKRRERLDEITLWYAVGQKTSFMSFWTRRAHGQAYKWFRTECIKNGNWCQFA